MIGNIYKNKNNDVCEVLGYFNNNGFITIEVFDGDVKRSMGREGFRNWRKQHGYKCVWNNSNFQLPRDRYLK